MEQLAKDLIKTIEQAFNLTDKQHREILKLYNQSRNNIRQFIADMYMRYGLNGKIEFAKFQRLHMHEVEQFINQEAHLLAKKETLLFPAILAGVLTYVYYRSAYQMEKNLKVPFEVGINFNLLRQEFIDTVVNYNWSGVPFSKRIWDNQHALVKSLRIELTQGLQQGESLDKVARRINKQFNRKAYESKRLIVTEAARVITDAQEQIYKDTGIVQQVQWMATLEDNTCDECGELDGKRFDLNDTNKPKPPLHPNCRCCYIAIPFDEYKPTQRKDNVSKAIIPYQSYNDWAKSKGII